MFNKITDSLVKLLILVALFAIGLRIENAITINKESITEHRRLSNENLILIENMINSNKEAVIANGKTIDSHKRLSAKSLLLIEKMIDSNKDAVLANGKTIDSHKKLSEENLQLNKDQIVLLNEIKNRK
jgi:hypothetical protein